MANNDYRQELDPAEISSEISIGNIREYVKTTPSTYSPEYKTTNYIDSLFKSFYSVADFWQALVAQIGRYITVYDSVEPAPIDIDPSELGFLDSTDEAGSPNPTPTPGVETNGSGSPEMPTATDIPETNVTGSGANNGEPVTIGIEPGGLEFLDSTNGAGSPNSTSKSSVETNRSSGSPEMPAAIDIPIDGGNS